MFECSASWSGPWQLAGKKIKSSSWFLPHDEARRVRANLQNQKGMLDALKAQNSRLFGGFGPRRGTQGRSRRRILNVRNRIEIAVVLTCRKKEHALFEVSLRY
jgi:hypothetical protein